MMCNIKNKFKKYSFSQSGEDLIIKFAFENLLNNSKPSYIDVGAFHPFKYSNTALFYLNGSRGINVEPDPSNYNVFLKYRKKDINLNIGVSDTEGEIELNINTFSEMNTFSTQQSDLYSDYVKKIKIKTDTINNIIKNYNNDITPDFLSVDAEGLDDKIIYNLDFSKYSPQIICVETILFEGNNTWSKNKTLIDYICSKGYIVRADTTINTIFIKEKGLNLEIIYK